MNLLIFDYINLQKWQIIWFNLIIKELYDRMWLLLSLFFYCLLRLYFDI